MTTGELFNISTLDPMFPTFLIATLCLCTLSVITYHSLILAWDIFWASWQSPSLLDPSAEVVLTDPGHDASALGNEPLPESTDDKYPTESPVLMVNGEAVQLHTGGEGAWKPVITCWVHLELMCIFPTMWPVGKDREHLKCSLNIWLECFHQSHSKCSL